MECTLSPSETESDVAPRCPIPDTGTHFPIVPVFMTGYMIIANVMLLNLLIAMLNDTYMKVEEEAEEVSNYLQYELITGRMSLSKFLFEFLFSRIFSEAYHSSSSYFYCSFVPAFQTERNGRRNRRNEIDENVFQRRQQQPTRT